MIRVIDVTGGVHEWPDGEFHTEDMGNNLVIETKGSFVVFAEGKWIKVEKVA